MPTRRSAMVAVLLFVWLSACGSRTEPPAAPEVPSACEAPNAEECARELAGSSTPMLGSWRWVTSGREVVDAGIFFDGCRVFMDPDLGSSMSWVHGCYQPRSSTVGVPAYLDDEGRLLYAGCGDVVLRARLIDDELHVERGEGDSFEEVATFRRVGEHSRSAIENARAGMCMRRCVRGVPDWSITVSAEQGRAVLLHVGRSDVLDLLGAAESSIESDTRIFWMLVLAWYSGVAESQLSEVNALLDLAREIGFEDVRVSARADAYVSVRLAREMLSQRDSTLARADLDDDGC